MQDAKVMNENEEFQECMRSSKIFNWCVKGIELQIAYEIGLIEQ